MKKLFIVRHGAQQSADASVHGIWQVEAELTEKGKEAIRATREALLALHPDPFDAYFVSPLVRARQSAGILAPDASWKILEELGPAKLAETDALFIGKSPEECPKGGFEDFGDDICHAETERALHAMRRVKGEIPEHGTALVVWHQPFIHFFRLVFDVEFHMGSPELGKAGMYMVTFDADTVSFEEVSS